MNEHAARPESMDELVQHSRYAGQLFLQPVPGDISARQEAENNAEAGTGRDRSMYAYAPRSGCPHPKQCPVVMVLGADASEASARRCPHALDIRTAGYLWQFLRRFAREADGALTVRL